ncbi:hypothetical protein ACTOB_002192 [Actinoplanes oblitus]|uniref:Uncharacterized protein n=1 Tax=Actinoplanes oblitus TaxID=3040509 RepID=A0ABY8WLR2_9ACTN|nr:hypothetical protein [Actinoplanes oblitus]WIM98588.1 hypothetical protein ACTOB_002192 [Actinoplanes oblitus]
MAQDGTTEAGLGNGPTPVTFWVAVAAVPLGVIFLCCPYRISILAPILVSLGVGAFVYAAMTGGKPGWRLLAALGGIVLVLALGGLLTRLFDGDNYRGFYGDKVTATVAEPGKCEFTKGRRGVGGSRATCAGATWAVGGKQRTGKISVDGDDIAGATGPVTLDGYAIGDQASSLARTDPQYDAARISGVPLWTGLIGLALLIGALAGRSATSPRSRPQR